MTDAAPPHATTPASTAPHGLFSGHPCGLSVLFFTEIWERFSYYGMRALLTLFMVAPVAQGGLGFATPEAARTYGNYTMAVYMLSILGGAIADTVLGARRAVLIGGAIIACGHFALAYPSLTTFYAGLLLIVLGTGLFKPNVSALVGHLYSRDDPRRDSGFSIFYMGVNIGAFLAPLVTGYLAQSETFKTWLAANGFDPNMSWHWGFAAAGVGMTLGLLVFVMRGHKLGENGSAPSISGESGNSGYLAKVAAGTAVLLGITLLTDTPGFEWLRMIFLAAPIAAILYFAMRGSVDSSRLSAVFVLFIAAMIFWAVFEQAGTTVALFADQLTNTELFGWPFPSSWFQSVNPIFVIILAPIFAALWLKLGDRQPSSPVKFVLGLIFLSASFALMVPAAQLTAAGKVSPLWLIGLFFLQTVGEMLLSPVGLSTMTKLAPAKATGLVLGIWFLAASWGNKLAGLLASDFSANDPAGLSQFFFQQAALVAIAALLLLALVPWIKRQMAGVT